MEMAPDSVVFGRNLLFRLVQFAELVVPNDVFLVQISPSLVLIGPC